MRDFECKYCGNRMLPIGFKDMDIAVFAEEGNGTMNEKTRKKREKQIKRLEAMQGNNIEALNEIQREISLKGRLIYLWFISLFTRKKK